MKLCYLNYLEPQYYLLDPENRPWPVRDAEICHTTNFNSAGRRRGFFCILFSSTGKKFVREAMKLKSFIETIYQPQTLCWVVIDGNH